MENFGICFLSIVPVRAEPSDKSEITTQMIFGDLYEALDKSENKKWIKIKILNDHYEGWIDVKQGYPISKDQLEILISSKILKTISFVTKITKSDEQLLVPAGSTFYQIGKDEKELFGEFIVEGEVISPGKSPDKIISLARGYLNVPYLWGGKTHFGIDCSGFTQQVFALSGYSLPRDAWQQEQIGEIVEIKDIKPTDVAFFKNPTGKIIHVGIILDKDQIIHASGKVRIDKIDEIGIFKKDTNEYSHFLACIRRIIN